MQRRHESAAAKASADVNACSRRGASQLRASDERRRRQWRLDAIASASDRRVQTLSASTRQQRRWQRQRRRQRRQRRQWRRRRRRRRLVRAHKRAFHERARVPLCLLLLVAAIIAPTARHNRLIATRRRQTASTTEKTATARAQRPASIARQNASAFFSPLRCLKMSSSATT